MKTLPLRVLLATACAAAVSLPSAAAAQELKIGYVNSERVLREAAPAKAAQAHWKPNSASARRTLPSRASG